MSEIPSTLEPGTWGDLCLSCQATVILGSRINCPHSLSGERCAFCINKAQSMPRRISHWKERIRDVRVEQIITILFFYKAFHLFFLSLKFIVVTFSFCETRESHSVTQTYNSQSPKCWVLFLWVCAMLTCLTCKFFNFPLNTGKQYP